MTKTATQTAVSNFALGCMGMGGMYGAADEKESIATLLEAIACAAGSTTVGSEHVDNDNTLKAVRTFAKSLRLAWSKQTRRGFANASSAWALFYHKFCPGTADHTFRQRTVRNSSDRINSIFRD